MKKLIARWESKSGKHWVELYEDEHGWSYSSPGACGSLGLCDVAIQAMQQRVDDGYFLPDNAKTPMKRVV